jgi:spore germination protein YaaH
MSKEQQLGVCLMVLVLFSVVTCRSVPRAEPPSQQIAEIDENSEDIDAAVVTDDDETEEPLSEAVFLAPPAALPVSEFREVWGYVIAGSESALKLNYPVTDICYFAADVNTYGELSNVPNRQKLAQFPGRVHLAVVCGSAALTHFVLEPGSGTRQRFINDLVTATAKFDGLNIDFENMPARDGANFLSFMAELRQRLPNKMLTIAMFARTRKSANEILSDYEAIAPLVDRIFVMAYDEHWSGSKPGPVSSLEWGRSVAAYTLKVIGPEKLVMGLPFYGRAWGDLNGHTWSEYNPSRAYIYSGIERVMRENSVTTVNRVNGIPTFKYETRISVPATVTVYYDDEYSLSSRMEIYRTLGVTSIGFWRLGQETPVIWSLLKLR